MVEGSPTTHNFVLAMEKHLIPLLIGKGGKNLYHKVIKPSIEGLKKENTDNVSTEIRKNVEEVKNGNIRFSKRININYDVE